MKDNGGTMKILVVFTGGTIGSRIAEDGYFTTDASRAYMLLDLIKKRSSADIEFVTVEPYRTLSENLKGSHIAELIQCIRREMMYEYDGIIVTHGTDTLQYTASALSYAFGNDSMPIMIVSSNYVLDNPKANGLDNFCASVDFIVKKAGKGTFVAYRNDENGVIIHRGSRVLAHQSYSDHLFSVKDKTYGMFRNTGFFKNEEYEDRIDEIRTIDWKWEGDFSNVLFIFPYVGMKYPIIEENIKAVVFGSYHSGTLCTQSKELEKFAEQAKEKKIPLFMAGADTGITYDSVKELEHLCINVLPQASPIAMYIKASMLASEGMNLYEHMYKSLGGDILH